MNQFIRLLLTSLVFGFAPLTFAQSNEALDPFFGAKERKGKGKETKSLSIAKEEALRSGIPLGKIIAIIGVMTCFGGGIFLLVTAARQMQQSKPGAKREKVSERDSSEADAQKFRLNEPYSDSKNIVERMVDPIVRASKAAQPDDSFETSITSTAVDSFAGSNPMNDLNQSESVETTSTGSMDVLDTSDDSAEIPAASSPGPIQAFASGDGETVTSPYAKNLISEGNVSSIEKFRPMEGIGEEHFSDHQADTSETPDSAATDRPDFASITETKPRLISAKGVESKSTPKKSGKRNPGKGGSDVA